MKTFRWLIFEASREVQETILEGTIQRIIKNFPAEGSEKKLLRDLIESIMKQEQGMKLVPFCLSFLDDIKEGKQKLSNYALDAEYTMPVEETVATFMKKALEEVVRDE